MKYRSKKILILIVIMLTMILIPVLINLIMFKPTKINAFIASKIYKEPANKYFTSSALYSCVVDAYNKKNNTKLSYTTNLTDEQLQTIDTLECTGKGIQRTDGIEKLTNLNELDLTYNLISEINLRNNIKLITLRLINNKITQIDLSQNKALTDLNLQKNQLTAIDLNNNIELNWINLNDNQLTEINLNNNINLFSLNINNNKITNLNTSKMKNLYELEAKNNKLTNIDISNNRQLEILDISNVLNQGYARNNIKSLNVSNNGLIYHINAENVGLEEIIFGNIDLKQGYEWWIEPEDGISYEEFIEDNYWEYEIYLRNNDLKNIDLKNISTLSILDISNNNLTSIDLSNNKYLEELKLNNNKLLNLDLSKNTQLKNLDLAYNDLKKIDLSKNTNLQILNLSHNELIELDLSKNTNLTDLNINFNKLTKLDLTKNMALTSLDSGYNKLTELDLSKNILLTDLLLHGNKLTTMDLSKNINLTTLTIYNNQLTQLDVTNSTLLTKLLAQDNQLKTIDIRKNTALTSLNLCNNKLIELDLSNNIALTSLILHSNELTKLDLSKNTSLIDVSMLEAFRINIPIIIYKNNEYNITEEMINIAKNVIKVPVNKKTTTDIICSSSNNSIDKDNDGNYFIKISCDNTGIGFYSVKFDVKVIELTSNKYTINEEDRWIYINNDNDINTIRKNLSVPEGIDIDINLETSKIKVLNDSEVLKEFDILKWNSGKYIINEDSNWIYVSTDNDKDTIKNNITYSEGLTLNIDNNKLTIKKGNIILDELNILKLGSDKYTINKNNNWIYIGTDNNTNTIKNNIIITDDFVSKVDLTKNKIEIVYDNKIIDQYNIINFTIKNYNVTNKMISVSKDTTYSNLVSNITTNGVSYKIYNGDTEVTSGNITKGMILKVYKDSKLLDTYEITDEYLEFSKDIKIDESDMTIYKLKEKTTVEDILSNINTSGKVTIKNSKGNIITGTSVIGTGSKVIIELSTKTIEYTLVVLGDVTGDGIVNISDVVKIADHTLTKNILKSYEKKAAEVTNNTTLNIADVVKIADYTLNKNIEIWK